MERKSMLALKIGMSLIILLTFSIVSYSKNLESVQIKEGVAAPDFTLYDLDGNEVTLSSFRGEKAVLLDFFASWCPSCLKEIYVINKLNNQYKKKGLVILGINWRESEKKVSAMAKKYKMNYTVLLDSDGEASKAYNVRGIPYLILIDKQGTIQWVDHWLTSEGTDKIKSVVK